MDMGKLRSQVLPVFLVLALVTKEINGFTLPQASKENKESLTEAMVIHFVTPVYIFDKGNVKTLIDSVCFLFSVGNRVADHLRKSINVKIRTSLQLDFFP